MPDSFWGIKYTKHKHLCRDCGAVLCEVDWCSQKGDHRISGLCPECQKKKGEFWAISFASCYPTVICRAKYDYEDAERYSMDYRPYAMVAIGLENSIDLDYISWEDYPDRNSDGEFRGCSNNAWLISDAEKENYVRLNEERKMAVEEAKAKERAKSEARIAKHQKILEKVRSSVKDFSQEEKRITDEGGDTVEYIITVTCLNGKVFQFRDRNVFDFGRVINPMYVIQPGVDGGLASTEGGKACWLKFETPNGWEKARDMDEDEAVAYRAASVLGGNADSEIRM